MTFDATDVTRARAAVRGRDAKCVLITGGAGFIGSNFTRYLHQCYPDYRLLVVDALNYASNIAYLPEGAPLNNHFEFWFGNVRDGELVDSLVSRADIVVHFAAETAVARSIHASEPFLESAVLGTHAVAAAVTRHRTTVERFIHISSSEVYGTARTERMAEDHPLCPMSPYAAAKCGADRLVYSYWQTYRTPVIIARPFNAYGPRQHLEKLVPRFITSCILGEELTVHGDGTASRDFTHVDDLCRALDLLLHAPVDRVIGEAFNLGWGRHITTLEMAHTIRTLMGTERLPICFIGDRPGQVLRHTADASKAHRTLGWEPRTSLEDGLRRTIAWYRENQHFWRPQLPQRNIPIVTASGRLELH